jgi:hypothetical protein
MILRVRWMVLTASPLVDDDVLIRAVNFVGVLSVLR